MSLDCYPLGFRKTINLTEQPIALDVAYNDNLFITVIDQCRTIVIYDLNLDLSSKSSSFSKDSSSTTTNNEKNNNNNNSNNVVIRKFSLGENVVIDQIIYNNKGDYLAFVGHKNGQLSVYIVFNWRAQPQQLAINNENNELLNSAPPLKLDIRELDLNSIKDHNESQNTNNLPSNYKEKLNCIDCCQRTGNLAISCGDVVFIYKYLGSCQEHNNSINNNADDENFDDDDDADADSLHSKADTVKEFNKNEIQYSLFDRVGEEDERRKYFSHIISLKLTITAVRISLLENYLSVTSIDHVQVLRLELLTLQIQSDVFEGQQTNQNQQQELQIQQNKSANKSDNSRIGDSNNNNNNNNSKQAIVRDESRAETRSDTTSTTMATTTTCTSSMISDSNSTTTNFSSFTNPTSHGGTTGCADNNNTFNNSDISIITMNNNQNQHHQLDIDSDLNNNSNQSADDCITWNLNTKKLVKLPTLMHNTSTNLSSYHIYHPLELLGPASESIACRVSASIYSEDFCQNQVEAVVMLCKQFDFEKDPIKSTHLQPIYLTSNDDLKRINKSALSTVDSLGQQQQATDCQQQLLEQQEEVGLLKSNDYELLASVTCFVSTLTNCFLYSLHGKKVVKTQTITHPDMCLDFRPDLLNLYLLSPSGLQICSTGICDSTFRYDWSSSADLNLSFLAESSKTKILTTSKYLILVDASLSNDRKNNQCVVEYMEKPDLISLYDRIVHTVNRCNSISIRSNMLTYLHATAQLTLLLNSNYSNSSSNATTLPSRENFNILKTVTIMLAKQLLQKKQTNVITNSKIDKAIKHLLDISMCDLSELMKRHWQALTLRQENEFYIRSSEIESDFESSSNNNDNKLVSADKDAGHHSSIVFNCTTSYGTTLGDDDEPLDTDYELIKIYLKYAKFSQSLLNYLIQSSHNQTFATKIIDYMYEHNPRLLIKCAQRYPINVDKQPLFETERADYGNDDAGEKQLSILLVLVDKLKQLAELDSTGINRATVLFTLAILYNALDEKQKCLLALDQIKPLNHLAITMCSNYEHSHSIANLVIENYPDVYKSFLAQLTKKDKFAAEEYVARHRTFSLNLNNNYSNDNKSEREEEEGNKKFKKKKSRSISGGEKSKTQLHKTQMQTLLPDGTVLDQFEDGNDCFSSGGDNNSNSNLSSSSEQEDDDNDELDEDDQQELFERKLKLFNEIPTIELVDFFLNQQATTLDSKKAFGDTNKNTSNSYNDDDDDFETCRSFIEASINVLESQFILARLRDNSSNN